MRVVDSKFYHELAVSDKERYLFLEDHPRISHFWMVESFDPGYQKRLDGVLSRHGHISAFGFERFREAAEKAGYELIFLDDPTPTFDWIRSLSDPPTVEIDSNFPNTIRGLLPFQVKAFNFAKDLPAAILNLSTGTGKTIIACALAEDQLRKDGFDVCLWVVKAHNKINTARMINRFIHRPSIIIDGDRPTREGQWQEAMAATMPIVVLNYEAFRIDYPLLEDLITNQRIFIVWDELPTKLRSRATQMYRSVAKALYRSNAGGVYYPSKQIRPAQLRQVMLSATPIEHSPEDFFNCITGDTEIETVGLINHAYRAEWRGPVVKLITALGTKLTIGPNHPVLTDRGWVNAQFLRVGDNVFSRSRNIPTEGIEDFDNSPSSIEQIFDACRSTSQAVGMKRASAPEFHGDAGLFKGEVEIVGADGLLSNMGNSCNGEQIRKSSFRLTHLNTQGSLSGDRPLDKRVGSVLNPQTRNLASDAPIVRPISCSRSNFDPILPQPIGNNFLAHTKLTGDLRAGKTLLHVEPYHASDIQFDTPGMSGSHFDLGSMQASQNSIPTNSNGVRYFHNSFARVVAPDKLIDVEIIQDWVGHMYDLSTSSGIYYGNGIATSNSVRLLDPTVYGPVKSFNNTYIAHRNMWGEPDRWRNLDLMGALASPLTFQVDKTDPHISKQFPKIIAEEVTLRLSPSQENIYRALISETTAQRHGATKRTFERDEILSIIQVLQYICDMPIAVLDSANKWRRTKGAEGSEVARKLVDLIGEDAFIEAGNVKVDALADLVNGEQMKPRHDFRHKDKIVVFAPYNETVLPYLSDSFEIWKIPHVLYHGGLSTKEKQAAQDRFTEDPDCRVFLSSDAGSDSINLECASTVIHYSLPWAWSTLVQRQNRIHRITSKFESVKYITLVTAETVEDRKCDIILNKYQFHKAVLRGEIAEQSDFLRAQSELEFILLGENHLA